MSDSSATPSSVLPQLTPFLQDLIRIHALPTQEQEIAKRVILEMQRLGFDHADTDPAGNVLGVVFGLERGPSWLLISHLDHVHEGDVSLWEYPPYQAELVDDGKYGVVHGRGAVDIKGNLAAHVYTLGEMLAQGKRPQRDVLIGAFVEEETGGQGIAEFMRSLQGHTLTIFERNLEIGAAIIGEPSSNTVMLGHRGVARVQVTLHGTAHHASLALHQQNPMFALGTLLERLKTLELPEHPIVGRSSLTPTQVRCDSGSMNLTSNTVTLTLDWRFSETEAEMRETLEAVLEGLPAEYDLEPLWHPYNTPGFQIAPSHPLVQKLLEIAHHKEPQIWRFATDGRYTFAAGIPSVGIGCGDSSLAHTTREKIEIAEILEYVGILTRLLEGETPDF